MKELINVKQYKTTKPPVFCPANVASLVAVSAASEPTMFPTGRLPPSTYQIDNDIRYWLVILLIMIKYIASFPQVLLLLIH